LSEYSIIGKSVRKIEGWQKVSGTAKYTDDLNLPGMIYGRVLRSDLPHAVLNSISCNEALKIKGVYSVLTHKDVPGRNRVGIVIKDEPVLVEDRIRRRGDAIALVAADSLNTANTAIKKIYTEISELPGVYDAEDAIAPGAPLIHSAENNIIHYRKIRKGDIKKAISKADIIINKIYRTQFVEHAAIENETSVALREGNSITVWTSTQNPHFDRAEIAAVLKLDQNKVRVIQQYTGGGFGGKLDISTQCHAALLAWHSHRPVKLTYTREESFIVSSKRHPAIIDFITAADKNGKIIGVKVKIIADTGAYASYGPGVVSRMAFHATGPYNVPNVYIDAYGVYTNNPYCGAMRGFGVPQVCFAHESQMELLAETLNISSWEIRKINMLTPNSTTATMQKLEQSVGIMETLFRVEAKAREGRLN